ncbi:hypothetical protein VTK73DRAFT_3099 [Phialemonium thermophilum]|uniref:Cell wall mannoprotein PIR1-like C-terminal domain-containing protein n=1 Tax=Phialemonium thermophilum TaxID=223376 RepID=A0ABR3X0K1_9PEZI
MKTTTLALASLVGAATARVVVQRDSAPADCKASYDGKFEITSVNIKTGKRDFDAEKRDACSGDTSLVLTLKDGTLLDAKGRTGYIASNYQFQFDAPPQENAITTSGFSVCSNGSLALGASTTFYKCQSGSFFNLYDRHWAAQCSPVGISVIPCGGASSSSSAGEVGQQGDGQVVGTQLVPTTVVVPISDGQVQVITTQAPVPICQIGDGQVQAHTTPCASITSAPKPPPTPTGAPIGQTSDGQVQVPGTGATYQPAPTGQPIGQTSDGQVQVPGTSAAPPPPPATQPTTQPSVSVLPTGGGGAYPGGNSTVSTTTPVPVVPSPTASSSSPATQPSTPNVAGAIEIRRSAIGLAVGILGAVLLL